MSNRTKYPDLPGTVVRGSLKNLFPKFFEIVSEQHTINLLRAAVRIQTNLRLSLTRKRSWRVLTWASGSPTAPGMIRLVGYAKELQGLQLIQEQQSEFRRDLNDLFEVKG